MCFNKIRLLNYNRAGSAATASGVVSAGSGIAPSYIPLTYDPINAHDYGFFLQAADGTCFDGFRFVACTSKMLWGVGIRYVWGEARRYLFDFKHREICLVSKGATVESGDCNSHNALGWGLNDWKLSSQAEKWCVSRKPNDDAILTR